MDFYKFADEQAVKVKAKNLLDKILDDKSYTNP